MKLEVETLEAPTKPFVKDPRIDVGYIPLPVTVDDDHDDDGGDDA